MARARPTNSYVEEWKRLWEPDLEAIAFSGATCDPTRVDPKVLQWVKKHCAQNPHFIKIVNFDAAPDRHGLTTRIVSRCKLRFPIPFARQHFRELERVAKLENEDGKTWKVAFQDARWHPTWQQGWFRFASDNSLKSGDIIVFVLVGKSHFRFKHFDKGGNKTNNNDIAAVKKEDISSEYSSQESDTVSDIAEDEHRRNFARNLKRAPPSLSKQDLKRAHHDELVMSSGLGFGRHGHVASQQCAPTHKLMIPHSPSRKRIRKLCKVGEKLKSCGDRGN